MITTDGLRLYKAAMTELGNADKQEIGRWANRIGRGVLSDGWGCNGQGNGGDGNW